RLSPCRRLRGAAGWQGGRPASDPPRENKGESRLRPGRPRHAGPPSGHGRAGPRRNPAPGSSPVRRFRCRRSRGRRKPNRIYRHPVPHLRVRPEKPSACPPSSRVLAEIPSVFPNQRLPVPSPAARRKDPILAPEDRPFPRPSIRPQGAKRRAPKSTPIFFSSSGFDHLHWNIFSRHQTMEIPKKLHGPPPPSRMAGPSEPERSEVEAAAGQEHEADLPLAADRFEGEGAGFPAVAFHELEDPLLHVAV